MCEQCFLKLSEAFKKMSEQAEKAGEDDIAEGLADMSLLAFTSMQLKNANVFNTMLSFLTLALLDQQKMLAIVKVIEKAAEMMDDEQLHKLNLN